MTRKFVIEMQILLNVFTVALIASDIFTCGINWLPITLTIVLAITNAIIIIELARDNDLED